MHVLALRFSAIGDVTLLVPAFKKALAANPALEITFVSKPFLEPLFSDCERLTFVGVKLEQYEGLGGLFRLASYVAGLQKDASILDLHDSLRTRIMRNMWRLRGKKVFVLDKGRGEKAALTHKQHKDLHPLKHAVTRYLDVFSRAGFAVGLPADQAANLPGDTGAVNWLAIGKLNLARETDAATLPDYPRHPLRELQIGYAPFAGFGLKELPSDRSRALLKLLLQRFPQATIILFGGKDKLQDLQQIRESLATGELSSSIAIASEMTRDFSEELQLIGELDLMLSMDSGNLHLAAVSGIPVVGLYGTTHPYLGFAPYGQEVSGSLGLDGLGCRPCTVYGNGVCYRGDFACMKELPLEAIVDRIGEKLGMPAQ